MSAITQALSAALIDFLWQGALVGLLLWTSLLALRHRSANARYAVACAALVVLVALPVMTVIALLMRAVPVDLHAFPSGAGPRAIAAVPQTLLPIWIESDAPRVAWLAVVQLWALPAWSAGVLFFSVRLAWGYTYAIALRRRRESADTSVLAIVAGLAGRMGIGRPVGVLIGSLNDGPSMLGWLRPVILLPPATAMGLTPQQLEAVLAHELAHIKRHDYLVNMLQVVAETLFFYHPVVWWTSKQIRVERELCCDDLAVRSCGDPVCYARALTTLEKLRMAAPDMAMAATGGALLHRIQRLLGAPAREYGPSRWLGVVALSVGLACVGLNVDWLQAFAEPQAIDQPQFEAASIKPNKLNDRRVMVRTQGDRYTAIGMSLRSLIQGTYQVQEFQIVGGPSWLDSDRFDIVAKAPPEPPGPTQVEGPSRQQLMMRALLAERFQLAVHKETRDMPIYALVMARSDARLGPQLHRSTVDCSAPGAGRGRGGNVPPVSPSSPGPCGMSAGPGVLLSNGRTMAQLASFLSGVTATGQSLNNRNVVDKTGVAGTFDVELHWTPDQMPNFGPNGPPAGFPPIDPNGSSIFTAVQEQLGLKLESQRGPVEVLVIDHVEPPTED